MVLDLVMGRVCGVVISIVSGSCVSPGILSDIGLDIAVGIWLGFSICIRLVFGFCLFARLLAQVLVQVMACILV